jgi:hypothetical protein
MIDKTEGIRRVLVHEINSNVQSNDDDAERTRLEKEHGKVWNTQELSAEFEVLNFMAPLVVVKRKSDGAKGSLFFQRMPRFYFDFTEDK